MITRAFDGDVGSKSATGGLAPVIEANSGYYYGTFYLISESVSGNLTTIQLTQQKMFYESVGKGPTLLLMHGWLQIGRDLLPLAKELAADYRVILPDLPGYGRSVPPFR